MASNDWSLLSPLESVRGQCKADYRPGLTGANHHVSFTYKLFLLLLAKAGIKRQMDLEPLLGTYFKRCDELAGVEVFGRKHWFFNSNDLCFFFGVEMLSRSLSARKCSMKTSCLSLVSSIPR